MEEQAASLLVEWAWGDHFLLYIYALFDVLDTINLVEFEKKWIKCRFFGKKHQIPQVQNFGCILPPLNIVRFGWNLAVFIFMSNLTIMQKSGLIGEHKGRRITLIYIYISIYIGSNSTNTDVSYMSLVWNIYWMYFISCIYLGTEKYRVNFQAKFSIEVFSVSSPREIYL